MGLPVARFRVVITLRHRLIARWMVKRGRYAKLPPWVEDQKPKGYAPIACTKCGTDLELDKNNVPLGFACVKCNYVHNGIRAWVAGEITNKEHPALKRHSRAELDAAGLADVLTLEEERATEPADKKGEKGKK